ncbi:hypothetical protein CDL12_26752 [Handroanthus impetiginosus]|uniref:Uncharacterized protein n=1 Tax=Handroanthus impetiginosus TaxID=429701 RepID=A0A2G9G6I3_9LAMI|nr:hypothetical protein CDL12_26752 [Handroanthus impetiginosus]
MKIFSWMKSKLHGKDNTIKPEPESMSLMFPDDMMHQDNKQEISGCPDALLAIGTFGNNLKHSEEEEAEDEEEEQEEEVVDTSFLGEIEEFFDCFPEDEEITHELINDAILQRTTSAVHTKGEKYIPSNKRKTGFYKKSLSFLVKKALLCGGGFVPRPIVTPIFKHPFPDPKLDHSTMDKILRAMRRKKKYHQRQKYLHMSETDNEARGETSSGNNWVKTDSEYIVLEL